MRRVSSAMMLAGAAALSGCMVGPKYKTPVAPTPPAYKEGAAAAGNDSAWQQAQPLDALPKGAWWTVFNDAELNTLEPQVEAANQQLKAADANLRAARATIRVRNADKYPTVGVEPLVGGERDSANQPYFNSINANNGVANLLLPVEASWELDLWGRIRRNINAAKEEAQASAGDRANMLLSLQAELATDYFEVRAADAQKKLLADTVGQYKEALRVTRNRFEGGISPKSDVTQAETQLRAAEVSAEDIEVGRSQYEHAIAILLGKAPSEVTLPFVPLPVETTPPVVPAGLPSAMLERRPDIAAAERRTAEANEQIGIARAAFFPTIGLTGAVGLESTDIGNLFSPSSLVYSVGPGLAYTLFDAGRRRGVSDQAIAGYEAQAANYKQSVLTAYQQVEDNLAALRILQGEAQSQQGATASALESERIFNNRYVGGVDTYLQVITAQTAALNNQRNDIEILRRRMDATVLLIKVLGGGWDRSQLPPQ